MKIRLLATIVVFFFVQKSLAQKVGFGFKTGLNVSTISQDLLEGQNNKNLTAFHIGGVISYKLMPNFGLRTEILYNQKGSKIRYSGPSYLKLKLENGVTIIMNGDETSTLLNINNSYIEIPIMAYYKFKKLEFSGGAGVGFLVSSTGKGDFKFTGSGVSSTGTSISMKDILFTINANYLSDDPGEIDYEINELLTLSTFPEKVPKELKAYSSYLNGETAKKFNSVDMYLLAGLSYYVNKGLYLGARMNYTLVDVYNNKGDLSLDKIASDGSLIFNDDSQKFINYQFSIGFNF